MQKITFIYLVKLEAWIYQSVYWESPNLYIAVLKDLHDWFSNFRFFSVLRNQKNFPYYQNLWYV